MMAFRTDTDEALDQLEARISRLEEVVRVKEVKSPLIESLLSANNMLSAAANKGKNIQAVNKRLAELNRVLTNGVVGNPTPEFERELNLIFSLRGQYSSNVEVLERVAGLHAAIDEGNLKSLDELQPDLGAALEDYRMLRLQIESADTGEKLQDAWQEILMEVVKGLGATNNSLSQIENSKAASK